MLLPTDDVRDPDLHRILDGVGSFEAASVPDLAEALLEQAATRMGGRAGEYISPHSVRRLIVGLAEPKGSIYNPGCGTGQLMIDALTANQRSSPEAVGQEINKKIWALAQLNLRLHGVNAQIELGDVFLEDRFPDLRADCVLAVPPWNQRLQDLGFFTDDARWTWGDLGERDGNYAWIQHCLYHLAPGGRAVIALPLVALFEEGRAGRVRQRIIKAGLVEAVIGLPPGSVTGTAIASAVVVFAKSRSTLGGKPSPTLMVDLSTERRAGSDGTLLSDEEIDEVVTIHRRWLVGELPTDRRARVVAFDEIAGNDYVVEPSRYFVGIKSEPVDLDALGQRHSQLTARLEKLLDVSHGADRHLATLLKGARGVP